MSVPVSARSFTVRFARIFSYFVYFWLIASLIILTLGFFLKLFAANPEAGFVEWVYRNLDRTMEPFRGMFPEQAVGEGGSVLDVSILFAMLMYGLVAMGLRALINWLTVRMNRIDRELAELQAQQSAAAAYSAGIPYADRAGTTPVSTAVPGQADPFDDLPGGRKSGGPAGR